MMMMMKREAKVKKEMTKNNYQQKLMKVSNKPRQKLETLKKKQQIMKDYDFYKFSSQTKIQKVNQKKMLTNLTENVRQDDILGDGTPGGQALDDDFLELLNE